MNLLDILTPGSIKVPLAATDKRGAIEELVDLLGSQGRVKNIAALKDAVWTREATRTTGIGYGLAIPHGKSDGVTDLAIAIGKPGEPLEFGSIDNKPVRLVVLLASPLDRTSDHIQALAKISRLMTNESFRNRMYDAKSAAEIYELIKQQESAAPVAAAPAPAAAR
ncbi:MAG TPA: PTS sugar transporter subunit IIA [Phycisphaerales bacterium]|nr:PTS sugar transporter subunit IIA [Phycisphaerales bacterium]